jgi:hypothetical protein
LTVPPAAPERINLPTDWPAVGLGVILVLGRHRAGHRSEIVAHYRRAGLLEVLAPRIGGEQLIADPGDPVTVTWTTAAGLYALRTTMVEAPLDTGIWRVEPNGATALIERRRYPRASRRSRASVRVGNGNVEGVSILDLSEAGFRCAAADTLRVGPGAALMVSLPVDGKPLVAGGEVAWSRLTGRHTEIGVALQNIQPRDLSRLRGAVRTTLRNPR